MTLNTWFDWFKTLVEGFAKAGNWLTTPLIGNWFSPLVLLTATGLTAYLAIAIVKWGIDL